MPRGLVRDHINYEVIETGRIEFSPEYLSCFVSCRCPPCREREGGREITSWQLQKSTDCLT